MRAILKERSLKLETMPICEVADILIRFSLLSFVSFYFFHLFFPCLDPFPLPCVPLGQINLIWAENSVLVALG